MNLDPYHTVKENVKEKILHLKKEDQDDLIAELLELVDLDRIKDRQARTLSGGEKQRLAIARALTCEPKVLLLDEPFVHLDQRVRLQIVDYLLQLHKVRKMTLIIVSHDGAELMGLVDKIVHVKEGGIERVADSVSFFYSPNDQEQAQLMGLINKVEIGGSEVLFRPNEYEVNGELPVHFEKKLR